MRRFLRDVGLLALPIVVLAIVLEWGAEAIPNSYTYKRDYVERHGGEVKTLILGSSNAYDGINPTVLSGAFNLANSSQTLEDDYRLLERYIDDMDSLQTVIVGLGYHSLGAMTEDNRRTYYTIYMGLYPRWPISKYSFEVFNLELLTKKIIKYAASRDVTRCDSLGQRVGHTAEAVKERKEFWNKDVAALVANDYFDVQQSKELVERNAEYLKAIIELCEAHQVQPVIVTMPVMKAYKEALPKEQVALHDSVMRSLPSSAQYIDASEWAIPDDGWYNATHLTKEESGEFTERVIGQWVVADGIEKDVFAQIDDR